MKKPLTKEYLLGRVATNEESGCWEWTGFLHETGYGELRRGTKRILAHRLAYFLWNDEWPEVCRHKCDNRKCCNPDHLENGTHGDNVRDRDSRNRGRWVNGYEHPRQRVTHEMVEEIFSLRSTGMSQQKIGDLVGIHQTEVSRILRGKSWIDRAQARKV